MPVALRRFGLGYLPRHRYRGGTTLAASGWCTATLL